MTVSNVYVFIRDAVFQVVPSCTFTAGVAVRCTYVSECDQNYHISPFLVTRKVEFDLRLQVIEIENGERLFHLEKVGTYISPS